MGTKKLDTLRTGQINALETDVGELRTKLNLVVDDALAISSKLNTLIGDLNDMNNVVMEGYTTPGSPESYGIQEAIDKYKDEWKDHQHTVEVTYTWDAPFSPYPNGTGNYSADGTIHYGTYWNSNWYDNGPWGQDWFVHPRIQRGGHSSLHSGSAGAASYDNPVLGGTDQGTNSSHSADAIDASVIGQYPNKERLLSVEPAAALRAKKLVRNILNKLRSK